MQSTPLASPIGVAMPSRAPVALALVLAAAPPTLARAADGPPAPARAKQVTGGARWDAVQTSYTRTTVRSGGLEGVVETWRDVWRGSVTVPFTLANNQIYVDVLLNGKGPFRALCDTGARTS